jgi:NAD(P)-dependent dehydrogenase (short-subunit alcohol dehydrogenase family)
MSEVRTQTAVIIGGTRGIGLQLAHQLASLHWNLAIVGRDGPRTAEVANNLSTTYDVTVIGHGFDVIDVAAMAALAREVSSKFESIDLVLYCAGVLGPIGPASPVQLTEFQDCLATNVVGFFNTVSTFVSLEGRGENHLTVVALSGGGLGGDTPLVEAPAYVSSKAAVVALAEVLAPFAESNNATINVVAPGNVPTSFLDPVVTAGPDVVGERFFTEALEHNVGDVREAVEPLLRMIKFLVSAESRNLNGRFLSARWDDLQMLRVMGDTMRAGDMRIRRIDGERYRSV